MVIKWNPNHQPVMKSLQTWEQHPRISARKEGLSFDEFVEQAKRLNKGRVAGDLGVS